MLSVEGNSGIGGATVGVFSAAFIRKLMRFWLAYYVQKE